MKKYMRFFAGALALFCAAPQVATADETPVAAAPAVADEAEKGILLLQSEPAGCAVTIDGQAFGTTPRLVTSLDAHATHRVTLRKSGYSVATFDVTFDGRTPLVRCEPMVSESGTLTVTTEPEGATVTVNGIRRSSTTPLTVKGVPNGTVTVGLSLEGYEDETREVTIAPDVGSTLSVALKKIPDSNTESVRKVGRMEVRTAPVGATVTVDGRRIGTTTSSTPGAAHSDRLAVENLRVGAHVLVVSADGYVARTRRADVSETKTLQIDVRLRKKALEPDVEIVTDEAKYRGVYVTLKEGYYIIEERPGVQKSISKDIVRKVRWLKAKAEDAP